MISNIKAWTPVRWLYLTLGLALIGYAVYLHEYTYGLLGLYFLVQAILNLGCISGKCGM